MLKYSYMIQDIRAVRDRFERNAFSSQPRVEGTRWRSGARAIRRCPRATHPAQ